MKLYLLPVLATLAWVGSVFSIPSADASAAPAPVAAAPTQTIYAGSLKNNWQWWGWANSNFSNKAPALSTTSIEVQAGGWQAIYLHHAALQTTPMMYVSFWINGGATGGQPLIVRALRSGVPQKTVVLGTLKANVWQRVLIALPKLGIGSVPNMDGLWIQNNSAKTLAPFYVDQISLTTALSTLPPMPAPAAPAGFTAAPKWVANCPTCGGMAMAHIILGWNAVSGASSYSVYRNGAKVMSGLTTPGWTDMDVTSGQTYSYSATATGTGGESTHSAPVSATAPSPPAAAAAFTAPANLRIQGLWQEGPSDMLAWSPVPGAASYNVYQYGTQIAAGLKAASYAVPQSVFYSGMTYSVTAVDSMGMESLPSAIVTAQGMPDPAQQPGWMPNAPSIPVALQATPDWNAGKPRIHLTWQGTDTDYTYCVYRDGQLIASGLWGLNFYDLEVQPGETHVYTVTSANVTWTQSVESEPSASISAAALKAAPAPMSGAVQITGIVANDDGAVVSFDAVPGAVDYRVYDVTKPDSVKYSGGSLSIEMNGLDPVAGADLVVEAVDKLGPFQTMDGMAGPGAMQMDGLHSAINGQGDPSNIPNVIAVSAPVHITCKPRVLTGEQTFFDTFRNEQPLTAQPLPALVPGTWYGDPNGFASFTNDKWTIRDYGGDLTDTKIFFMGNHFMDTLYDGGTPGTSIPMHNNNASLVMMPNAVADISGGKVLHVTFEVDPHMDGRRWCDVFVGPAGDTLVDPGKFADFSGRRPTLDGKLFRWEIQNQVHALSLFPGIKPDALSDIVHLTHQDSGVGPDSFGMCARAGAWCTVPFNGTTGDLDKRHKFDLYLSANRVVIMEQGLVVKDTVFPDGVTLPFDKCQVYFVHQLYHTANDRLELLDYTPGETYWYNNRPWSDERHWDNMGQEVLDTFPTLP
ncbi:MAG: hypothetical protein ACRYFS_07155 [Janthinobacterium lividum]